MCRLRESGGCNREDEKETGTLHRFIIGDWTDSFVDSASRATSLISQTIEWTDAGKP
jgi:hypothetical protein